MATIQDAIKQLADEAQNLGATANDDGGIVRAIVENHNLGFYAWFCVCCELADRKAQSQGFPNQFEMAASRMKTQSA